MPTALQPGLDPWKLEIVIVRGAARTSAERSSIGRDVERGLLLRIAPGSYVERHAFEAMSPEERHVVRMRAADATSPEPLTFSHWSVGILHGVPVLRSRLGNVHVTVPLGADLHRTGITAHRHPLEETDVERIGGLRITTLPRTVIDVAGASAFEEGVMAADRALLLGLPRHHLEIAAEGAADRRAAGRIGLVVAFGDPGGESAAESRFRVSSMRAGFEPPELQHPVLLREGGAAWVDAWFRRSDTGIEVDGEQKYLDAGMAPDGAGRAAIAEKRREDEVRLRLRALIRPGWVQSGSPALLRALLAKVDVHPSRPRTPVEAYVERSRDARPRPTWRPRSPSTLRP